MNKVAYVFPGQGSQYVGMGKELADDSQQVQHFFDIADKTLDFSLSTLCFEGPEDSLRLTYHTQPALLTVSAAVLSLATGRLPNADFVAGHSLGEYSALLAAKAISFEEAVRLVHTRGTLMNEAVPAGKGAMAAVLGGDRDRIAQVCEHITFEGDTVQLANINSPKQVVISGTVNGVERASAQLKDEGIRRIVPLDVSGPFHSELMKPAASKLAHYIDQATIQNAQIPVISNVDALPIQNANDIRQALTEQVFSAVRWQESVEWMIQNGVDTFIEIGPGKVLAGLIKKIDRSATVVSVETPASIEEAISALSPV